MKDYVFIIRNKPLTPGAVASVTPKWAVVIPKWTEQGHFVDGTVLNNEGHLISGNERIGSGGLITNDGHQVVAVLRIKADSFEQAIELSKECPTLDLGATVEVREVQPRPTPPVAN